MSACKSVFLGDLEAHDNTKNQLVSSSLRCESFNQSESCIIIVTWHKLTNLVKWNFCIFSTQLRFFWIDWACYRNHNVISLIQPYGWQISWWFDNVPRLHLIRRLLDEEREQSMVQSQYLSVLNTEMRITEGLIKQIMPKDVALQVRLFFILFYSGNRRNFSPI